MDQSQFQAYEVAGATDMNRLHQFPQDYFQEVVEGFIGDVSDALFGTAGFSSSIVAGPELQIDINAQTFAAGGRIGRAPDTTYQAPSSVPADTQRFYIYLDIQTTEVTESRDIANPGTGVKTPTNIVTHKTAAAGVVVIEVNQGDPEAPPPLGPLGGGVERVGYIKLGYVDYNEIGVTNVDVFNSAGIFTQPGLQASLSFNDLSDASGAPGAAGQVARSDGANIVISTLSMNDLALVSGVPGSAGEVLTSDGVNLSMAPLPRRQLRTVAKSSLINKAGAGGSQTISLVWSAGEDPDDVPPQQFHFVFRESVTNKFDIYILHLFADIDETAETWGVAGSRVNFDTSHNLGAGAIGFGTGTAWAVTTGILTLASGCVISLDWTKATRTLDITFSGGANALSGYVTSTLLRTQDT